MSGQSRTLSGELVATRAFRDGAASAADLSNVIPFARARRTNVEPYAPPVIVKPAERPAPLPPGSKRWLQVLLVVCSLIMHGSILYLFWQDPPPLPGVGVQVLTVDVVVGDNRLAGAATTPGLLQAPEGLQREKPDVQELQDQKPGEIREVKEEARREVAKEEPKEQDAEKRQVIAMVETLQAEVPTVLPRETPPDMQAVIALTREEPKEVPPVASDAVLPFGADAARGSGKNGMSGDSVYLGQVSAHLQRHKQYPMSADRKHITGNGKVEFVLDGRGRVTSASVTAGTGVAVLDQELTAMVRRASPFPAPPDGEPKTFNVPVSFEKPK